MHFGCCVLFAVFRSLSQITASSTGLFCLFVLFFLMGGGGGSGSLGLGINFAFWHIDGTFFFLVGCLSNSIQFFEQQKIPVVFVWFEEVGHVARILSGQNNDCLKKSPTGSKVRSLENTSFLVKMRLNKFGSFWSYLGQGWCIRKEYIKFQQVTKFKFGGPINLGLGCTNWSVSQEVKIFDKRSMLTNWSLLTGSWSNMRQEI